MHAYQHTQRQELINMLESHLKDLDRASMVSKRLIKDHEANARHAQENGWQ